MQKKEITTKENLIEVLDLLDSMKMRYWIDGVADGEEYFILSVNP